MIIDFNSIRDNLINNKKIIQCKNTGNTLLHTLIINDDLEGFKKYNCILKEFINNRKLINKIINAQNFNGDTPAHIAVRKSNRKNNMYSAMVEILQELGADFTISNKNNEVITKLDDGDKYNEQIKNYIKQCLFNQNDDLSDIFTISVVPENETVVTSVKLTDYNPNVIDNKPNNFKPNNFKPNNFKPNVADNKSFEIFTNYSSTSPRNFKGGGQLSYNIEDSLDNVDNLSTSLNIVNNLNGGGKYSESSESSESSNSNSIMFGKRYINNPYIKGGSKKAQQIHNDIIEQIKNLGYSEQEAKDIKNALYYEVKDKYPSYTNTQKAEKMLELVKDKVKNIDMKDVHKILEKKREHRNKDTKETKTTKTKTKEPKETKKTSKKTSKRVKKNKK